MCVCMCVCYYFFVVTVLFSSIVTVNSYVMSFQRLERHNCLVAIEKSRILGGYRMSDTEVTEVRHFLYKSRSVHQFTSPLFSAPYHTAEEQQRLLGLYQYLHVHMHGSSHPLKMLFHIGDHEALLGYVSQLYLV